MVFVKLGNQTIRECLIRFMSILTIWDVIVAAGLIAFYIICIRLEKTINVAELEPTKYE